MPYFIFDMDGTLLESMEVWRAVSRRYLEHKGITPPEDIDVLQRKLGPKRMSEYMIEHFGITDSPREIGKWCWEDIEYRYFNLVEGKPGVKAFLDECKRRGIRMCIATSTNIEMTEPVLKRLGLYDYFEFIHTCQELNTEKHLPDIFVRCCEDFGCDVSQAVVFEDAYYAVKTVTDAGFYTVAIAENYEPREDEVKAMADQFLTSYTDLDWKKLP